ncbi:hypothetical protein A2U01_0111061, partial [Trifolium medium]|nr:hypothetical protein [Trifolium medium]
ISESCRIEELISEPDAVEALGSLET